MKPTVLSVLLALLAPGVAWKLQVPASNQYRTASTEPPMTLHPGSHPLTDEALNTERALRSANIAVSREQSMDFDAWRKPQAMMQTDQALHDLEIAVRRETAALWADAAKLFQGAR